MIYLNVYLLPGQASAARIPLPAESRQFPDHAHGPVIEARRAVVQARLNEESKGSFIAVIEPRPALAMVTDVTGEES